MDIFSYVATDEANGKYSTFTLNLHRLHKQIVWAPSEMTNRRIIAYDNLTRLAFILDA